MSWGSADGEYHGGEAFPIPMRGNELQRSSGEKFTIYEFPIPMRGNERTVAHQVAMLDQRQVSDPHEG